MEVPLRPDGTESGVWVGSAEEPNGPLGQGASPAPVYASVTGR